MRSPAAAAPNLLALAGLLLLSGFSALVYQTLWLRLLGLLFGVTVYAASTVLAAFMAGLAIGSLLAGRLADRVAVPLRWFGAAELLVAATALATPALLGALEPVYRHVHAVVSGDAGVLTLARFAGSFAVLSIPTAMMGATMPLAIRAATPTRAPGRGIALLYGANTAGAVAGALLTGYYLVGHIGIAAALRVAAAANLVVAVSAFLLATSRPAAIPGEPRFSTAVGAPAAFARHVVLAVFAVSGLVTLTLEVIWFRILVMFTPATTYAFTTMLAFVLGGIAAGSGIAHLWLRRHRDWIVRLGVLEIGIAVAALASLAMLGHGFAAGWVGTGAWQASALAVLPTALLLGLAFPIGLSCWVGGAPASDRRTGDLVGRFYLVNLSGGILGAVVGGFFLLPNLGTRRSLIAVASISLAAGVGLLALRLRTRPGLVSTVAVVGAVAFVATAGLVPDPLHAVLARRYAGERVLWQEEGVQTTVSVHESDRRVLYLDGLHQASDGPRMLAVHRLIGSLGMALHPDPRRALVIGLGGGATAGAVAGFPGAFVDIVELSPSVLRAAEWMRHANDDVLRRSNVRVRIDDGRQFLLLTEARYDVITADLIEPFHAGAGNLYSLEYFRLAAGALAADGLLVQWIGLRAESQYKLIARTFLTVFPHATVWENGTLLVGAKQPLTLSRERFRARARDPAFGRVLDAAGIHGFEELAQTFSFGPDELRRLVGPGPLLTDDQPLVEFFLSLPREESVVSLAGVAGEVGRHIVP